METDSSRISAPSRLGAALLTEWRELGRWGKIALAGVAVSVGITLALGFSIPRATKSHLLHARTEILEAVTVDLVSGGLVPIGTDDAGIYAAFDDEVRLRLLGGETVRVKLWTREGAIAYSDNPALVGRTFELTPIARSALDSGTSKVQVSGLEDPAHELERDLGELIEFYLPVQDAGGEVVGLFEVEQAVDSLDATIGRVRRNVWASIGIGLGVLTVFMGSLTIANAHVLSRRRRQAEELLAALLRAQEDERRRVVGALHDDVGQPLYRILYGLQGSRAKLDPDHHVAAELASLESLVRQVDRTLRQELRLLHHSVAEDVGLAAALQALVEATRRETDLDVELELDVAGELPPRTSAVLYRAAQEGLTNARKHSGAGRVSIRLARSDGLVVLEVEDDGDGAGGSEGIGLATTRERLEAVGGGFAVDQRRGAGTRLRAWIPAGPGSPGP